jgi:hypothetical protein
MRVFTPDGLGAGDASDKLELQQNYVCRKMGEVKTTVEIPDALFRQAKAFAAQGGVSLNDFLAEALREHVRTKACGNKPAQPWMRAFGGLRELHRESKRVDRIIKEEFEHIDDQESH